MQHYFRVDSFWRRCHLAHSTDNYNLIPENRSHDAQVESSARGWSDYGATNNVFDATSSTGQKKGWTSYEDVKARREARKREYDDRSRSQSANNEGDMSDLENGVVNKAHHPMCVDSSLDRAVQQVYDTHVKITSPRGDNKYISKRSRANTKHRNYGAVVTRGRAIKHRQHQDVAQDLDRAVRQDLYLGGAVQGIDTQPEVANQDSENVNN